MTRIRTNGTNLFTVIDTSRFDARLGNSLGQIFLMCPNELCLPSAHTGRYPLRPFSLDTGFDVLDYLMVRPLHLNSTIVEFEQLLCLVP
jgi:hypothetical protein